LSLGADNFCPCLSGKEYSACCEPFVEAPSLSGEASFAQARASLRHQLLHLALAAPDMPELRFSCLDEFTDPERIALGTSSGLQQPFLDHFLWDWFRKYSEARPISRLARSLEASDLRLARRLDDWGLAPWEPWEILSTQSGTWQLQRIGSEKTISARPAFAHHAARKGDGLLCRILPHVGHDFTGLSVTRFPGAKGLRHLRAAWTRLCREFGISPGVKLRPDVHNEQWHPFHLALMRLHPDLQGLAEAPPLDFPETPAVKALDLEIDTPLDELGHQTPRQAAAHEMGRHRLRRWLDRRAREGADVSALRLTLKI